MNPEITDDKNTEYQIDISLLGTELHVHYLYQFPDRETGDGPDVSIGKVFFKDNEVRLDGLDIDRVAEEILKAIA